MTQFNQTQYNTTGFNDTVSEEGAVAVPGAKFNEFQYNTTQFNGEGQDGAIQELIVTVSSYIDTISSVNEVRFEKLREITVTSHIDPIQSTSNAASSYLTTVDSYIDTIQSDNSITYLVEAVVSSHIDTIATASEIGFKEVLTVTSSIPRIVSESYRKTFARSTDKTIDVDEDDTINSSIRTSVGKTLDIITQSDEEADGQ